MKLHSGPEWCIFHILTSEDIDDMTFPQLFVQTDSEKWRVIDLSKVYNKKNITRWPEDMNYIFSC